MKECYSALTVSRLLKQLKLFFIINFRSKLKKLAQIQFKKAI